jgi:hypothetical protein
MKKIYPKLYARDSNGGVRQWWLEQDGNAYWSNYGVVDGAIVNTKPIYAEGKNAGKKNETSPEDQAAKECENLYKKQKRLNYFENVGDIDGGFLEPQLAKPGAGFLEKVDWKAGPIWDVKLNGWASWSIKRGIFSRTNKQYFSIPHIEEDLVGFFETNPDAYLQGELYNPAYKQDLELVAELISVGRKPSDLTSEVLQKSKELVQLHLYDGYGFEGITINSKGLERREALMKIFSKYGLKYCFPVKWKRVWSWGEADAATIEEIQDNGEGGILRNPIAPYQHKRTKDLLKIKREEDAEFKIISIEEGSGNWAGCAKFVWLELPDGLEEKKFKSNLDGSQDRQRQIFQNRDKYVGKWTTVRYEALSKKNVPLKPYCSLIIRSEIEGEIK